MLKRKGLFACSLLCLVILVVGLFSFSAQEVLAADATWENNADVSWIDPSKKLVALTFDDGPIGTAATVPSQRILDVMEEYGMHCTFFYWGERINSSNIAEIERAYSLGCELGNHTFTHPDLTNMNQSQIQEQVKKTNDLLEPISGNASTLIRPPYGSVNNTVSSSVDAPLINWSRDSGDWNNGNYNSVLNQLRNVQDGDIVLLHENYEFTAQAVETAVPELIEKGFVVVTVSELMKMKGIELKVGTQYTNQAVNKPNVYKPSASELVEKQIADIGEVTLESEIAIIEARAAYNALTEEEKALVKNYDVLTDAEAAFKPLLDAAIAQDVEDLIAAIGEVTLESEGAITDARIAYDELSDEQKALIENYNVLVDAEAALDALKNYIPFTDVSGWYENAVRYVYRNELMNGTSATTFNPDGIVSRAQLVTILYRIEGEPKVSGNIAFTDVKAGQWYSDAIQWAAHEGIVKGVGNDRFNPEGLITREQIATILHRYSGIPNAVGSLNRFPDKNKVSSFAADAMAWAVENGLINGVSSNGTITLAPQDNATRSQIATVIMRYDESGLAPEPAIGKIGISMPTGDLMRWKQDGANLKKQLEAARYEVDLQYASNNPAKQAAQIENMIANGCKTIVVAPVDDTFLGSAMAQAKEAGVAVVSYDRLIRDTDAVLYYVTFDNFMVGVQQGQYIADTLNLDNAKEGTSYNIEFVTGDPGDNNIIFYYTGAMSVLQKYLDSGVLVCQSGQTDITDVTTAGWDAANAQKRFEHILSTYYANKPLHAVMANNDSTAQGVAAAITTSYSNDVYPVITGQDCDIVSMINMLDGKQAMSVFKDTRTLVAQTAKIVDAIMRGTEIPINDTETYDNGTGIIPSYLCLATVCTKDNYKELLIDSGYYTEADLAG